VLEALHVSNYALIEEARVEFTGGLNVLTGETGAGKSILVGALNLVLGARASSEVVRSGADKAQIDAVFRIKSPSSRLKRLLEEYEIDLEEDTLLLSRSVARDGRSRAYVSGRLVPLAVLSRFGDELVDFHGQHDHQSLLKTDLQLDLLDAFARAEQDAANLAAQVELLREVERELKELETEDRERERRLEFRRFELNEIQSANLVPGEEEELKSRRNLITNMETIVRLAADCYAALYEAQGTAAIDQLNASQRALAELASFDPVFREMAEELDSARTVIEEVARRVRQFATNTEFDPNELNTINERLAQIGTLKRKYGTCIEEILEYAAVAKKEIENFEQRDEKILELRSKREKIQQEALSLAAKLSEKRRKAARQLDRNVTAVLTELGMGGGGFATHFENVELRKRGTEQVEFLLSANVGEQPKPLRMVASGGEISRVMLAIKSVLAQADQVPTLVFDEIDAGVGGATANKVAAKLAELAETHQVLCITHLPAIAAAGKTHILVTKNEEGNRALTRIVTLQKEERVKEIARLLDGTVSGVSLEHAKKLLRDSVRK